MINNLLKTWSALAQSEADYLWGFDLETRNRIGSDADFSAWLEQPINKAICQGYIQRCIEARGWSYQITNFKRLGSSAMVETETSTGFTEYFACEQFPLLTAYLKALAAQRTIAPNTTWQHFKGGDCTVMGQACHKSVSGLTTDDWLQNDSAQRLYRLEENPEIKLWLNYYRSGNFDYSLAEGSQIADYGDRIFDIHDGIGYARKVDDFLSLVGSEHPEHEGLLRFVEIEQCN